MATAYAAVDYNIVNLWAGEVEDLTFDWTRRMLYSARASATFGTTATGTANNGWTGVGETASAFAFYVPAGLSALASGTAQHWSAYLRTSGASGSASASSLVAVQSTVRVSATATAGGYLISARLRTSSGRELRDVVTANIQG